MLPADKKYKYQECCDCPHITPEFVQWLADKLHKDYKDMDSIIAEYTGEIK